MLSIASAMNSHWWPGSLGHPNMHACWHHRQVNFKKLAIASFLKLICTPLVTGSKTKVWTGMETELVHFYKYRTDVGSVEDSHS